MQYVCCGVVNLLFIVVKFAADVKYYNLLRVKRLAVIVLPIDHEQVAKEFEKCEYIFFSMLVTDV